MTPAGNLLAGAAFVVLGGLLFTSMGVGIRFLSTAVPNQVLVFFRNLFSVLFLTPWLLRGGLPGLATALPGMHLLRALAGLGAMYCFFYAMARIPLADAMLLKLTTPLLAAAQTRGEWRGRGETGDKPGFRRAQPHDLGLPRFFSPRFLPPFPSSSHFFPP